MKKLLSLTLAMMMAFSVTAFAETTTIDGVTVDKSMVKGQNTDKKYDVVFTSAETNHEYMLWGLKGIHQQEDISSALFVQANVLYVNQATAVNNQVTFSNFLPMENENLTLVISGGETGPEVVGYIAAGRILGDLNGDGKVTIADAELLLAHVVKANVITNEEQLANADMTQDGNPVNMDDVVLIMKEVKAQS